MMEFRYFVDWPPEVEVDLIALDVPAVEIIEVEDAPIITIQNEGFIFAFDAAPVSIQGDDENDNLSPKNS